MSWSFRSIPLSLGGPPHATRPNHPLSRTPHVAQTFVFLNCLVIVGLAPSPMAQNEGLLDLGLELVAEGDTAGALVAFVNQSPQDAATRFNAGTLALATGDLGMARYQLLAASRLAPFSESIAHNLALANERAGIAGGTENMIVKTWRWIAARIGSLGLVLVALALYLTTLALFRYRRRRQTRLTTLATAIVGLAALCFLCFATTALWNSQRREAIVIAEEKVPVHTIPNPDSRALGSLEPGESIRVLEAEGAWTRVQSQDRAFWAPSRAIERLPF